MSGKGFKTTTQQEAAQKLRGSGMNDIDPAFGAFRENLAWSVSPAARKSKRRLYKAVMASANAALPALIQRVPADQPINAKQIAEAAVAIASGMALEFVKNKLV